MPASIVVAHCRQPFMTDAADRLEAAGVSVKTFADPFEALEAIEHRKTAVLLITCMDFPPGKPNGVSLALMARRKTIDVLFVGAEELREHAEGLGRFLPLPLTAGEIVAEVELLLRGRSDMRRSMAGRS